ncbi:MAG: hypothetical protein Q9218_007283 [Villophora microphyllina]
MGSSDFAEAYPNTTTIGTDLSPIQPDTKPPNLTFEIDDCCSDWVYPKEHFDYIHVRQIHLAPGGYLEQAEMNPVPMCDDGSIKPGDAMDECGKLAVRASESFDKSLMIQEFMQDDIRRAGFTNIVKITYKWPIGAWSNDPKLKALGGWNLMHWIEGLEGWTLRIFTKYMGWTYERVKKWNADMRHVLRDRKYHAYQNVYEYASSVVYARKPL